MTATVEATAEPPVVDIPWADLSPAQVVALKKLGEPTKPDEQGYKPVVWCKACGDAQYKVCDKHTKQRCDKCGNNITTAHTDLTYMGHASVTHRLLEVDPSWSWRPMARRPDSAALAAALATGNPEIVRMILDNSIPLIVDSSMWIELTVCGLVRPGYGDATGRGGVMKEIIGDAIRNAAMRFGCGLDLWHKGEWERKDAEQSEQGDAQAADAQTPSDPWGQQASGDPMTMPLNGGEPQAQSQQGPSADDRPMDPERLREMIIATTKIVALERLRAYVAPLADQVTTDREGVSTRFRDLFEQQKKWIRDQP